MINLVVIMDMNNGFAKEGALYSPRTEKLIQPIADFCKSKAETEGWTILALSDSHDPSDIEFGDFPPHCIAGTPESEVVSEIKPYCDLILPKYTTGGFFEIQEAAKSDPRYDLSSYDEIHVVGCCTDLCIFNFSLITQKYMEFNYHNKNIRKAPKIIVHKSLIDTYDTIGHSAEKLNQFFPGHMVLNGIEITE